MSDSASQAMQTLTAQWYNAITTQLHLSPNEFQLAQGDVALGSTSTYMWTMMDSIPPASATQYWTPGGYNSFASNYGSILSQIQSSTSGAFQTAMKDYFQAWMTYVQGHPPAQPFATNLPALFQSWAYANMPPDQAQTCYDALMASLSDPIGAAQQAWQAVGGQTGVKAYDITIEQADALIARAPNRAVDLNSQTESSDISHTWAKGSVEGFYDLFFGEAGASYDAMTSVVTNAGVDISIQFTHVLTIPVVPLRTGSIVAGPTTYQAWYVPAALQAAYNDPTYQIWKPSPPDWNSFFGDSGSMPRGTAALIVVDGIKVSLNSLSSIAEANRQEVQASFEAGFFPFFGVSGSGGWSNSFTYNDAGQIFASSSCSTNNPQVLGVLVLPIANLIALPELMEAARARRARAPRKAMARRPQTRLATAAVPVPMVVTVGWSDQAEKGLQNLPVGASARTLIHNRIDTWAENNASKWNVGDLKEFTGTNPNFVATALLVTSSIVNIKNFV